MPTDQLPDFIDPFEYAEKKRRIKGSVPVAQLDRIEDSVLDNRGEIKVDLTFHREKHFGLATVTGSVETHLVLQCQCCLEPLPYPVRSLVHLAIVSSLEEADRLPKEYEPLMATPGASMVFLDIIQEEILLAIPSIPKHLSCKVEQREKHSKGEAHPFALLTALKKPLS